MRGLRDLVATLGAIEESVATRAPRQIAEQVVAELQEAGPKWTGTFRNAWRINHGDTPVAPTVDRSGGYVYERGDDPNPEPARRITVPALGFGPRFRATLTKRKTVYTIGNASRYRELAMDLEPGRKPPRTAPQDWFITYMDGGAFTRTVQVRLDRAIQEAAGEARFYR